MTLRMDRVAAQLPAFLEQYGEALERMKGGLRLAEAALSRWSEDPAAGDAAIARAMAGSTAPYALSLGGPPAATIPPSPPGPVTVVAADGSSIEPDRFAPVACFVVNTGWVVLPYGVTGEPELESQPALGPSILQPDTDDDEGAADAPRGWGVNLLRDVRELEWGADRACERLAFGDCVLLLDGTLLPWDLDSRQVPQTIRDTLARRTLDAFDRLATAPGTLALGAYISGSRSADVVTSLRALSDRTDAWPAADGALFAGLLAEGERSALFRARSERNRRVEALFPARDQVCFFYLRTGDDVARVELPQWVADDDLRVQLLHSTLVDQCRRCDGYPRALQEAHEQAVISVGDRQQFANMVERLAAPLGLRPGRNGKAASKRSRAL